MEIIILAIGLLLTGVDIPVMFGISYPAYVQSQEPVFGIQIQGKIQEFVTENILSAQCQIDILPDVIGCLLLLIGSYMLVKQSKRYVFCEVLAVITLILSVGLRVMPFFLNGGVLVVVTLILFVAQLVFEIWTEYHVIYATVNISDAYVNKGTNRRVQFLWWIAIFARVWIALLTFSGLNSINLVYQICVGIVTILFLIFFLGVRKYIGVLKVYKEGFTSALVPDYIREKIADGSIETTQNLDLDELRHVKILYVDKYGRTQEGELLVKENMAFSVMKVFYQLYRFEYVLAGVDMLTGDGSEISFAPDWEAKEEKMIAKILNRKGFVRKEETSAWQYTKNKV